MIQLCKIICVGEYIHRICIEMHKGMATKMLMVFNLGQLDFKKRRRNETKGKRDQTEKKKEKEKKR